MNSSKTIGIIPARYASTRFPGKPLTMIAGKTMIHRVYKQASKAKLLDLVVVATDDERIAKHVTNFGGKVIMTANTLTTGTERCSAAFQKISNKEAFSFIVNIQGDEPFINPKQIDDLVEYIHNTPFIEIATLAKSIKETTTLFNPNIVKVIFDQNYQAIYFSRAAIPYLRGVEKEDWISHQQYYKHIGLYAYKSKTLKAITQLKAHPIEQTESLEQLRWLLNKYAIGVCLTELETIGIDTPEDLDKAIEWLA